jgi:hypothetical protein
MHPIQDLFWKGFSYVLQIDMHLLCAPVLTKFYSCKKRVLQVVPTEIAAFMVDASTWVS